jgi:16S rRNA (cytidine1402-2'-O)-methyltransferase
MPLNSPVDDIAGRGAFGTLYVVATPIGNLADITLRAIDTLKTVNIIAAEDTRHTRKLLDRYQIRTRLISCHEHNEAARAGLIVRKLQSGLSVALVSDAGTPTVSDPGYRVLRAAIDGGIRVVPIPGASAAVAALSVSGLPSDAFLFVGFLPPRSSRRRERLKQLARESATLVFYESSKRILDLMAEAKQILGDRNSVLAREMTKTHETMLRGRLSELIAETESGQPIRGEITLLVSGAAKDALPDANGLKKRILEALETQTGGAAGLARELSKTLGVPKNTVYQMIIDIKSERNRIDPDKGEGEDNDG